MATHSLMNRSSHQPNALPWLLVSALLIALDQRREWRTALPLALVIGGALGNLIDRLHASQVTDFIHVYFREWNYPVFNLADCGITVGAVMLVVFGLFQGKTKA